jgi:1-acyl-sn-glycerol-3-phosphate acyltransferase
MTNIPKLPPLAPKRISPRANKIAETDLSVTGWRIEGDMPNLAKCVMIGAPHTSNWDFFIIMMAFFSMKLQFNYMMKASWFKWPYSYFTYWTGGIPVYRNKAKKQGLVEQMIKAFQEREALILAISPEGTRSQVTKWHTGFYHIAVGANVPIICMTINYPKKIFKFLGTFKPTGNLEQDLPAIQAFYNDWL